VTLALLTYSVTKYYHYLLPVLPPLAVVVGLWLAELTEKTGDAGSRRTAWVVAGVGVGVLGLVLRDVVVEPAWIAHLTTYLYDRMWREGAPPTERLIVMTVPFALALLLWAARRGRAAAAGMVFSALLTLGWVMNSYLPAVSENWSQRSLIRTYYDQRGPEDPLMSWWFYYRGETFFTKANVWVLKDIDKDKLYAAIDEQRGHGRTIWMMTTAGHAKRVKSSIPSDLRAGVETVQESSHYALVKFPVP